MLLYGMFAFNPPKSYDSSHPTPPPSAGQLPNKPTTAPIPTPLNYTDPQSMGLVQKPKVD